MQQTLRHGTRAAGVLLLLVGIARAGLPQPSFILYGQARDEEGWPYQSDAQIILKVNGSVCATHDIKGSIRPGVNFVLRVPLDSGSGTPYSSAAARPGDSISIVVFAGGTERTIMAPSPLPNLGTAGGILNIDVTAGTDSDHDGLPDEWEQWLVDYDWYDAVKSIADVNPQDDFDKDGVSNRDEFLAGSFAELDYDYFHIESEELAAEDRVCLAFLSIPGKVYTVSSATNLVAAGWSPCPVATSLASPLSGDRIEGTGGFLYLYVERKNPQSFYRLEVR